MRIQIKIFLSFLISGGVLLAEGQAQDMMWRPIGGVGISDGEASHQSIDIDQEGKVWLAFMDAANGRRTTVLHWDGNEWVAAGGAGISEGSASSQDLSVAPDGSVWVAYSDNEYEGKVTVLRWVDGHWTTVGYPGISDGSASHISLDVDQEGRGWVAYRDWPNNSRTTVLKWDGQNWMPVGGAGISEDRAEFQSLAVAPDGSVWVAYQDHSEDPSDRIFGKLTVMKWNENDREWTAVGGPRISQNIARHISLAIHPDGFPWVAYSDHSFLGHPYGRKTTVLRWNGEDWTAVGGAGISEARAWFHSLAFAPEGTAWVAFRDGADDWDGSEEWNTTVLRWSEAHQEWQAIGERGISRGSAHFHSLSVDWEGTPWLAYQDNFNFNRSTVISWQVRQPGDKEMHELDLDLPVIVALFQNYPNPFNTSTVIRFQLPRRSHVRLDIYTSDGRLVRTILDEEREMGYHEVPFDASGLSSGVYFCRLIAGGITRNQGMLLVK